MLAHVIRPDVHERFLRILARAEARARDEADRVERLDIRPLPVKRAKPVHKPSSVWTAERRDKVAQLWNAGASLREIQAAVGHPVNTSSISYLRNHYGLRLKSRAKRKRRRK
jgi:hypothetical protein